MQIAPGTTTLVYSFQATNTNTLMPNTAYLDDASLEVSKYRIWTYGDTSTTTISRDSWTASSILTIGDTATGEINVTLGRTLTTAITAYLGVTVVRVR